MELFDSILGSWTLFIALMALAAFGYWLNRWVQDEPKALGAEQEPPGPGATWWKGL
ncbi:MAG: hypothetical protein ACREX4_19460 [Gammaproteobacteria bacterium]